MVLVALVLFGLSILLSLSEVYWEWDAGEGITWPTGTGRYVLIFGAILLMSLAS